MSTKLLSTMPCHREPFNSSARPARKPAVFAASFQLLGAVDIKASFQCRKRAKRPFFHKPVLSRGAHIQLYSVA